MLTPCGRPRGLYFFLAVLAFFAGFLAAISTPLNLASRHPQGRRTPENCGLAPAGCYFFFFVAVFFAAFFLAAMVGITPFSPNLDSTRRPFNIVCEGLPDILGVG